MPIYFVRSGVVGPVKIGWSAGDVIARVKALQTAHPQKLRLIRVLDGAKSDERAMHGKFSALRQNGEWFNFNEAMLDADIGLPDLPIPLMRKRAEQPQTAWGREVEVHVDIIESAGGRDTLARRLGCAPWDAMSWRPTIFAKHFSAAALIAREAGLPLVTVDLLLKLHDEVARETAANAERRQKTEARAMTLRAERAWVKKNGAHAAWWPPGSRDCCDELSHAEPATAEAA